MTELEEFLVKHEGFSLEPYRDTAGKLTIGVGRNLDDNGISKDEAVLLLQNDLEGALHDLHRQFSYFSHFNKARRFALISMMFNLGSYQFSLFKKMIKAIEEANWELAADEALDSLWAIQVKDRAQEIAFMLKAGKFRNE